MRLRTIVAELPQGVCRMPGFFHPSCLWSAVHPMAGARHNLFGEMFFAIIAVRSTPRYVRFEPFYSNVEKYTTAATGSRRQVLLTLGAIFSS